MHNSIKLSKSPQQHQTKRKLRVIKPQSKIDKASSVIYSVPLIEECFKSNSRRQKIHMVIDNTHVGLLFTLCAHEELTAHAHFDNPYSRTSHLVLYIRSDLSVHLCFYYFCVFITWCKWIHCSQFSMHTELHVHFKHACCTIVCHTVLVHCPCNTVHVNRTMHSRRPYSAMPMLYCTFTRTMQYNAHVVLCIHSDHAVQCPCCTVTSLGPCSTMPMLYYAFTQTVQYNAHVILWLHLDHAVQCPCCTMTSLGPCSIMLILAHLS